MNTPAQHLDALQLRLSNEREIAHELQTFGPVNPAIDNLDDDGLLAALDYDTTGTRGDDEFLCHLTQNQPENTMSKAIQNTQLTDSLALAECSDGFWLYDRTQGMNLSIRAKTPQDAFVEALTYYQRRLAYYQEAHGELTKKVEAFVSQFVPDSD